MKHPEFLPMTRQEMTACGYDELDILIITGDCYVDHPSFGISLIGRILLAAGFRTGVIAQFPWQDPEVLKVMGTRRQQRPMLIQNLQNTQQQKP